MKVYIASAVVAAALFLDTLSYYRQIKKTIKAKHSNQISAMSFLYKIGKACLAMIGLAIYNNYVGLGMECFMLVVYMVTLWIICSYKPKGWRLF
jgi:uncharacterized protein with PQ loop repeat